MKAPGRWFAWILCVVFCAGMAGCNDAARIENTCEAICRCQADSPTLRQECIAECIQFLPVAGLPAECLDCLTLTECSELNSDACEDECQMPVPRVPNMTRAIGEETYDEEID